MPRSIQVSLPSERADALLARVERVRGVVGLARMRGASVRPPGDIVRIETTNDATRLVFEALSELDIPPTGSIVTNAPRAVISAPDQVMIDAESNETTWDEMAFLLREDTNLSMNYLAMMAIAGAIAATGLWTDTLHVVVASMIIAPAFEPLVRVPFGMIASAPRLAKRGALASIAGYGAMIGAGLVTAQVLRFVDPGRLDTLASQRWVEFWSTLGATDVLVSTFAALAGSMVIIGQRAVLTTGVMIALALIPSASLVGLGLGIGDLGLAGDALVRWLADVGLVLVGATLVFGLKQAIVHRISAND